MIDPDALLNDLKPQVRALENDLRDRAGEERFDVPLRAEWDKAVRRNRTAATYETWLEDQVTQSAVAWVLSTVFLRFCEDNRLIDDVFLSGRGERLDLAKERQQHFFEQPEHASETDREWIVEGLDAMSKASPVAAGLFDRNHNPMWRITPSLEGAKALIDFWRRSRPALPEEGLEVATVPVHDFTDPKWNTRFLGNLYQDLSEHAKKKYALLQTPEFVEEFILSLTLDEAINEFGLDPEPPEACPEELNLPRGLRVIDPTCGSGHFLLGAFEHLVEKLQAARPYDDKWDVVQRALYSVHGVDKNPFAVAIARFRMLIAAMQAGEVKRLKDAPEFALNIAVGDSLIHGRGAPGMDQGTIDPADETFTYITEDISKYIKSTDILGINSYHAVFGNPPYIPVADEVERKNYRKAYQSCSGTYALSVPFMERFFQLAIRCQRDGLRSGFTGKITSNSFMKRKFGKRLVEEFLPIVDLTHIIDTSGAYIPNHGTDTVILIGRRRDRKKPPKVRSIFGVQREPGTPERPAKGLVWREIIEHTRDIQPYNGTWVSIQDTEKTRFTSHPWSLAGGGISELAVQLTKTNPTILKSKVSRIGFFGDTHADEIFILPPRGPLARRGMDLHAHTGYKGGNIRDWNTTGSTLIIYPYNASKKLLAEESLQPLFIRRMWPFRSALWSRGTFGGRNYRLDGRKWWEWHQLPRDATTDKAAITFADVATHTHFTLFKDGGILNRSAPIIKFQPYMPLERYYDYLGILNSSAACFWLKQYSQIKGGSGIGRGIQDEAWEQRYQFDGTKLGNLPLPARLLQSTSKHFHDCSEELTRLGNEREALHVELNRSDKTPTRQRLLALQAGSARLRERMIFLQEELDWESYRLYGLLSDEEAVELIAGPDLTPEVKLGERAFEIVLARRMAVGEVETAWFARHGSTPVTDVPQHWPEAYRRVVERRIEVLEKLPQTIGLIERPEYKRRWASEPWEKMEKDALRNWLLDRCETHELWFLADETGQERPRMMTVGRLADRLQDDADFVSVARLYASEDTELIDVLKDILDTEHVPFIPAYRYKDSGLRKRAQWEETWRLQRLEDETGERLDIKVPPKYTSADFVKNSYWRNRGKLDVPKERFISCPDANPDGDNTLLLGWAGWDHAQQAHALVTLIEERTTRDGWELERLMPLLAGLDEVLPWVKQWHSEVDPETGLSPAVAYEGYLQEQVEKYPGLSREELAKWRPPKKTRGRGARKKKADA